MPRRLSGSPSDKQLHEVQQTFILQLTKMLMRRRVPVEETSQTCLVEPGVIGQKARTLHQVQAAVRAYAE